MKTYVCRRIRLYDYLSRNGFTPYSDRIDKDNPKYKVWLYEETEELKNAIDLYYSIKLK